MRQLKCWPSIVNDNSAISAVLDENNIIVFHGRRAGSLGLRADLDVLDALSLRRGVSDDGNVVVAGGAAVGRYGGFLLGPCGDLDLVRPGAPDVFGLGRLLAVGGLARRVGRWAR